MEENLKYQDLLYFGYDWSDESNLNKKQEDDFIKEIKKIFPHVKLKDAYNEIKGFRQEVYLNESDNDNYYSFIIAHGYYTCSLSLQLIELMPDDNSGREKVEKYLELAKQQYPQLMKKD